MEAAVATNQCFLAQIASSQDGHCESESDGESRGDHSHVAAAPVPPCSFSYFSKVVSTLHQFVREWSAEGEAERDACFGPLLAELCERLPVTPENKNKQRVLVPGAGLGRLVFEVVRLGYACQGNEFSLFMLFASSFVLNCTPAAESFVIHPWIDNPSNHFRLVDMCRMVRVPDVCPADILCGAYCTTHAAVVLFQYW